MRAGGWGHRGWGGALVVVALTLSAPAHAQSAAAEALFDEARQAMKDGDYATACPKFEQSDGLDPQAGTKFNWAYCEEKRGRVATAWELYRAAARAMPADDERRAPAEKKASALEATLPRVKLRLAPGAPAETTAKLRSLVIDSRTFGVPLPVDPGAATITVAAPGYADAEVPATFELSKVTELEIAPGPKTEAAAAPVPMPVAPAPVMPPPPPASDTAEGSSSLATAGWIVGGIGAAGLVVGTVTGILVLGAKSTNSDGCNAETMTCTQDALDAANRGKTLGVVTTVSWVVGAAALAGGITMIALGGDDDGGETATLSVGPTGATLGVRF